MNVFLEQRDIEIDALEHICNALEKGLAWEVPKEAWATKASSLRFLTQSLRRYMERVFTAEEQDGYMASLVEDHAEFSSRVDSLRADHDTFRAHMREILHRMEGMGNLTGGEVKALYADISRLVGRLRKHHRKEASLLQDSLLQDTGGEG